MKISHEQHNAMNSKFQAIKAANPAIQMRPTAAQRASMTTADFDILDDLYALSDVASTFSSGLRPSAKSLKRAMKLITSATA